ncbi:hypothetical protein T08_13098 [Trichinella sp. T8]|nr:hypothetical protein T08_13098 [Trichinella sp. T8]
MTHHLTPRLLKVQCCILMHIQKINHKRISSYCKAAIATEADHIQISIIALGRRYPLTTIHLLLRHCCSLNSDNDQQREIKFITLSLQHLDYCYYYLFLGYL